MKIKKVLPILVMIPLLASCGGERKLVIPEIDVDSIVPTLPKKPTYNQGQIANDGANIDYLDFYEVSDFHGAVNYEKHSSGNYMGLPKLASYLNIRRQFNQGGTIVVSSGDMFQGSADSNLTRGYMVNYAMNYMGFDSMAIGNHEFDWTDSWLKKNANLAYKDHKIPYISANIVDKRTNATPDFISKSTIIERGGYKIGIVGSIGETLESSILKSCIENYDFTNQVEAINSEAAKLKNVDKCDVVVLTAHDDIDNLAGKGIANVDAIFGGHAHVVKKENVDNVIPAVQTENYGKSIAHIKLAINKETKAVSCSSFDYDDHPLNLYGLTKNHNISNIMNSYSDGIKQIKDIKLGKAKNLLKKDGALKGICVESMYQGALKGIKELGLGIKEEDIVATFHNVNGGIRSDIKEGDITYGDIYNPFPFDNEIVLYKVKGAKFTQVKGKYASLAVRRTFEKTKDLEPTKDYYVVLTDFIALSGEFFGSSASYGCMESELIRTGRVVRDEVANFIYEKFLNPYSNLAPQSIWYKLSEAHKNYSIYCANGMPLRLKCFDPNDKDMLFEAEHRRRMMSMLLMGYSAGKTDKKTFTHQDVTRYELLSDDKKKRDESFALNADYIVNGDPEENAKAAKNAKTEAENIAPSILVMSPSAASFDMFKNVYDRGAQFQKMISEI